MNADVLRVVKIEVAMTSRACYKPWNAVRLPKTILIQRRLAEHVLVGVNVHRNDLMIIGHNIDRKSVASAQ